MIGILASYPLKHEDISLKRTSALSSVYTHLLVTLETFALAFFHLVAVQEDQNAVWLLNNVILCQVNKRLFDTCLYFLSYSDPSL